MSTSIEWTHGPGFKGVSWNPVTGCSHVSEGCRNCYAETLSLRKGWSKKPWTARNAAENVVLHPDRLDKPLHWRKPRMVFVNSMSDLFHEQIPDEYVVRVFDVMRECAYDDHVFQVLTKRPERMRDIVRRLRFDGMANGGKGASWLATDDDVHGYAFMGGKPGCSPLPNVWLGVSCENQETADERIPILLDTPAAVRWVSAEPLLGPVDLEKLRSPYYKAAPVGVGWEVYPLIGTMAIPDCDVDCPRLDWVVAGGESGPGHRVMDIEWARSLRDQCQAARVPFFMKQDSGPRAGKQGRIPDDLWIKQWPRGDV